MPAEEPRVFFDEQFRLAYKDEREPYFWQFELFERFVRGDIPSLIDLPTGTGKTSVMLVWYLALAWLNKAQQPIVVPLRLVWVVNRRVVVDQATDEARAIQSLNLLPDLAISTLRGELADNGDWKRNPTVPAIVIGTVDMIGSKLLFSGYGDGSYWRPHHAGLLGVDTLIINDEAHLTPAFEKLIQEIEKLRPAARIPGKQFRVCSLSATPTGTSTQMAFPGGLGRDAVEGTEFYRRANAKKKLYLYDETDKRRAEAKFLEVARQEGGRTLVFREGPEDARKFSEMLEKLYPGRVALLTGTMRGLERDNLLSDAVFRQFLQPEIPGSSIWLVATSAGEVGVNLTCERQVTMLTEAEHLIQRFGRLNRFGGATGEAHVVFTAPAEKEPAKIATLRWLQALPALEDAKDIRGLTLFAPANRPTAEMVTAPPRMACLDNWLIELWSQTTGKTSYPKVEMWLHGKQEGIPETSVAWRWETEELTAARHKGYIQDEDLEEAFRAFPILAHERITEPAYRVKKKALEMAAVAPDTKVLVRDRQGKMRVLTLEEVGEESRDGADLDEATVILPLKIGQLSSGMFSPGFDEVEITDKDVADQRGAGGRARRHFISEEEEPAGNDNEKLVATLALFDESDPNAERRFLHYCETREKRPRSEAKKYLLSSHLKEVRDKAAEFAARLVPHLESAFRWAGEKHDMGKDSPLWQSAMGRCQVNGKDVIVAKSYRPPKPRQLAGYRHELGSLARIQESDTPGDDRELALHLIASHHGHARPHFHDRTHDVERLNESQAVIDATAQRFARLSEEWGPWGLAYLEAIFRSADGFVSAVADGTYKTEGQTEE